MKKSCIPLLALLAGASTANAMSPGRPPMKTIKVTLTNTLYVARPNAPVVLSVAALKKVAPDFDPAGISIYTSDAKDLETDRAANPVRYLPFQVDDVDGDGMPDEIALQDDLPPGEGVPPATSRLITILYGQEYTATSARPAFPKRAHASYQQKYEGLGWESDRVGWRMYFDERNAFDMWGKKQHAMLLDYFALPGVDYHSESPLGRDTYKIGDALGIGSVGAYVDGKTDKVSKVDSRTWKVIADGPVRAIADLIYKGWDVNGKKVDITSRLTVWGGQHWFDHHITVRGADGLTIVTGLPVKPASEVLFTASSPEQAKGKAYALMTWGHQVLEPGATSTESLPDHTMGLAVIIPDAGEVKRDLKDPANHLVGVPVTKQPDGGETAWWRVVSAWDEEAPDGDSVPGQDPTVQMPYAVRSQAGWQRYVATLAAETVTPVEVSIRRPTH